MSNRRLRAIVAVVFLHVPLVAMACEVDTDCGASGTCIKREKRAHGVCYGGSRPTLPAASDESEVAPRAVTGERRERAKYWLGDPDAMLHEALPGQEVGATCMVTQDCPGGFECVVAGFEGHCMKM